MGRKKKPNEKTILLFLDENVHALLLQKKEQMKDKLKLKDLSWESFICKSILGES